MGNILNIYFGHNIGGIEKNVELLSKIFLKLRLSNYFMKISENNLKLNIEGDIFSLDEKFSSNVFVGVFRIFRRSFLISKFCLKNKIKYSISHGDMVNISNLLSKILFFNRANIILTVNNSFDVYRGYFLGKIILFLIKILYKKADKIIFISEEMKNDFLVRNNVDENKVFVIYNPVDLDDIEIKKNHLDEKYKNVFNYGLKTFLTIGRLENIKNQKFIIDVFDNFFAKNKEFQLLIVGDGILKKSLDEYISNLPSKNNIKIVGYVENIYSLLCKSDYFLFSSFSEGFGRVLIEATVCGVPILTHDFKYGAKEILRKNGNYKKCDKIELTDNGILVPYMDKEKYLIGMNNLINQKFNKKEILNNAKIFDIEIISEKWKKVLD